MKISDELMTYLGISEILVDNLGLMTIEMNREMQKCGIKKFKNKQSINHLLAKHKELNASLNDAVEQVEQEGNNGEDFLDISYFCLQLTTIAIAVKPESRNKVLEKLKSFIES